MRHIIIALIAALFLLAPVRVEAQTETPVPTATATPRPTLPSPDITMSTAFTGINHFFSPFFGGLIFLFMVIPALAILKWLASLLKDAFSDD